VTPDLVLMIIEDRTTNPRHITNSPKKWPLKKQMMYDFLNAAIRHTLTPQSVTPSWLAV